MTAQNTKTLLVEIRVEELPPAQLWRLADIFPDSLLAELQKAGFADNDSHRIKNKRNENILLATPRRLVALLKNIKDESLPRKIFRRGPQLAACYDNEGAPNKALIGFMQSVGITCEADLTQVKEKDKTYIAWEGETLGRRLADDLAAIVERVLLNISAPRLMRWGDNDFSFIRPIRGVLFLRGDTVINGAVMNINATNTTQGHPILSDDDITITQADDYEKIMENNGRVIVDMIKRRDLIKKVMKETPLGDEETDGRCLDEPNEVTDNSGSTVNEKNIINNESPLLREVTAMCEYPIVYQRKIDDEFMSLPKFCIVECLKKHQRFFPFDECKKNESIYKLSPYYFLVADNKTSSPDAMLRGYDSVLRARLCDVQFYYQEDKKIPLDDYVDKLKTIVFHKKLSNQYDRINRVCQIANTQAAFNNIDSFDKNDIEIAAKKYLASLPTLMAGEYPNLQEYMSEEYFIQKDNSEATLKEWKAFIFVKTCYHLEKLTGMFGIGEIPTGSKDPHGLRRSALEVAQSYRKIRDIKAAIHAATLSFNGDIDDKSDDIYEFLLDRIKFIFSKHAPIKQISSASPDVVDSVLSLNSGDWTHLAEIIESVHEFYRSANRNDSNKPQSIIAANKRINNIFRKSNIAIDSLPAVNESLFIKSEEKTMYKMIENIKQQIKEYINQHQYTEALEAMLPVTDSVNAFFDNVMVNADDEKIRHNRFALLKSLRDILNSVADISKLSA